jgi:endonuclease/exonuclease/phosphatase family metal-dependent hydrolase
VLWGDPNRRAVYQGGIRVAEQGARLALLPRTAGWRAHRAQFAVLAHVVNEAGPRAVVCGDFNIARESLLFGASWRRPGWPMRSGARARLRFRAEYLPAGATPHCIDFILTAGEVTVESAALVFAEKEPLGYVSDHIGLSARLSWTPTG